MFSIWPNRDFISKIADLFFYSVGKKMKFLDIPNYMNTSMGKMVSRHSFTKYKYWYFTQMMAFNFLSKQIVIAINVVSSHTLAEVGQTSSLRNWHNIRPVIKRIVQFTIIDASCAISTHFRCKIWKQWLIIVKQQNSMKFSSDVAILKVGHSLISTGQTMEIRRCLIYLPHRL